MSEPQRYAKGVARREELVSAAAHAFSSRPFAEITMAEIAESAGVAKGLLSYYFGSKRDLYLAVLEHYSGQLLATLDTAPDLPAAVQLTRALDMYVGFAEDSEPAYRTIMAGVLGDDPVVAAFVAGQRAEYRKRITRIVLGDQPEPAVLRTALEGFLSFMEGAALDWLSTRAIERETLHALILAVAAATMTALTQIDPSIQLDLTAVAE